MAKQGFDRGDAPSAAQARGILDFISGDWCAVYLGGTYMYGGAASWSQALVESYRAAGIGRFLPVWVGEQAPRGDWSLGYPHGLEAAAIAHNYGWLSGPIVLDVEFGAGASSLPYIRDWCNAVRSLGYRPGLYANLPLLSLPHGADFVWVANWVGKGYGYDPNIPPPAFGHAHQYAGGQTIINGLNVDLSIENGLVMAGEAVPVVPIIPLPPLPPKPQPTGGTNVIDAAVQKMIDDSLDPLRKMVIGEFALFSLRVKALEDRQLPVPAPSPVPVPARKTYIAVAGDNLSVIAARNNLSLAEIERLNPQFSPNFDLIHPGDLVYLS